MPLQETYSRKKKEKKKNIGSIHARYRKYLWNQMFYNVLRSIGHPFVIFVAFRSRGCWVRSSFESQFFFFSFCNGNTFQVCFRLLWKKKKKQRNWKSSWEFRIFINLIFQRLIFRTYLSFIFSQKNFCEFFSIHADFKKTLFHHRGIFTLFYLSLLAIFPPQRANKFHYIIKKRKKKDRVCKLKKTRLIRAKICFSSQNISSYSFPALIVPLNCM